MDSVARVQYVTGVVNELFGQVSEGFINAHNEPVTCTPTVVTITPEAAEVVITGSTICLSC